MVMMYVKYPLSLRNVEELLFERGFKHERHLVDQQTYKERRWASNRAQWQAVMS